MKGEAMQRVLFGTAKILDATLFSAQKHQHQRRKDADGLPYILHPLAVARILAVEAEVEDETVLMAALLHDTIEDTDTKAAELEKKFGEEVRRIVEELSDDKNLDKEERKKFQISHAPTLSAGAKQIKIADKISNIRDIVSTPPADWSLERKTAYLKWAEKVVAGCRGVNGALEKVFDETVRNGLQKLNQ